MKHLFKTGILLMAITLSLVSCREQKEEKSEMEQLMEEEDAKVKIKDDKVKVKTDDKKIKIKTDDDGEVTKKVKTDDN